MKAKIYVIDCFQEKSSTVMACGQSGTTVNEATTAVGKLVLHLQQNLRNSTGITVSEVVKSGSLGHGTAVQGNLDVDLVLYSRDIDADAVARDGYGVWLGKVKRFLELTLRGEVDIQPVTEHAVQFQYKGIDVDLLVSPYWEKPSDLYQFLGSLPADDRFHFSVSAAKWQVEFFQKQPNQVKEFAKRAKAWRNKKWPKIADEGRPKSYLISLLVLCAHEEASAKDEHRARKRDIANETTVQMRDIVNDHKVLNFYWESDEHGYYRRRDYPHLLPARPRIIDPANPTNNLYVTGINRCHPKKRDGPDGNWTLFKEYIDTLDLTKPVEEI